MATVRLPRRRPGVSPSLNFEVLLCASDAPSVRGPEPRQVPRCPTQALSAVRASKSAPLGLGLCWMPYVVSGHGEMGAKGRRFDEATMAEAREPVAGCGCGCGCRRAQAGSTIIEAALVRPKCLHGFGFGFGELTGSRGCATSSVQVRREMTEQAASILYMCMHSPS